MHATRAMHITTRYDHYSPNNGGKAGVTHVELVIRSHRDAVKAEGGASDTGARGVHGTAREG